MIYQWGSDNHSVKHFASIVGFYFNCWVLLRLLGFTLIVGFCVDCWDLFKLWKFCIILVELEKKFWIGKYIAEYTMMRQMKPQILFKPRHTEKWTHFCTNHDHHEDGGYRWLLVSTGEYRWVLGESLMAVKKDYKISRVVMVITRKILNLLRVAGGHE